KPLALKGDPFKAGAENQVSVWAEMLIPEGAQPLAFYDHPFFGTYPAITQNHFGSGTLTYEGTVLSEKLQGKVLLSVLQMAGLTGPDQELPVQVRVKHGTNRAGKNIHYYMNYSSDPQVFKYQYKPGDDLLTKTAVTPTQTLTLKAWDLVIIEEK
ncbi:MAG TPA: beta-galactosidase trimerization domain-containing protein, partial [Terriglobia bacterium]|nr:beta-galactosidase trimerization domain-containing protein [Terriglobia bacterium]